MNTHVTINFTNLGFDEYQASALFQQLRAKVSRWWRYQRSKGIAVGPLACVHSHANPAGSRHVHWLLHVPASVQQNFEIKVAHFLRKLASVAELKDALQIGRVNTPGSLAKYMLRGIDPDYAEYLHIEPANEGFVSGRRTGASKAVSKAARRRAGWVRKKT